MLVLFIPVLMVGLGATIGSLLGSVMLGLTISQIIVLFLALVILVRP